MLWVCSSSEHKLWYLNRTKKPRNWDQIPFHPAIDCSLLLKERLFTKHPTFCWPRSRIRRAFHAESSHQGGKGRDYWLYHWWFRADWIQPTQEDCNADGCVDWRNLCWTHAKGNRKFFEADFFPKAIGLSELFNAPKRLQAASSRSASPEGSIMQMTQNWCKI